MIKTIASLFLLLLSVIVYSQAVPSPEENIPFLVTFGNEAPTSWGDDDHSQTFFFVVPKDYTQPVFIRVFDPDVGGKHDEVRGDFNTKTTFAVYGGSGAFSNEDARQTDPVGEYKSGNQLASKTFGKNPKYDDAWYTFGPFNPSEGELVENMGGYIFKVICEGVTGDDGNLYRYFMSTMPNKNVPIEGGNAFTYEYTFRLHSDAEQVSHIYPFIDDKVVSIKQSNFDFDNDGYIRIVSVGRKGEKVKMSGDDEWSHSEHKILDVERNTSLDIQFIKRKDRVIRNNNVVFYVTNQYGELLPFYTVPIGGVPKYQYNIGVKPKSR